METTRSTDDPRPRTGHSTHPEGSGIYTRPLDEEAGSPPPTHPLQRRLAVNRRSLSGNATPAPRKHHPPATESSRAKEAKAKYLRMGTERSLERLRATYPKQAPALRTLHYWSTAF